MGMSAVRESDMSFMARALVLAEAAAKVGEVPVGALLVDSDGSTLAEAVNSPITNNDPTAHAEIQVLRAAGAVLGNYRLPGTTLYVSLEPCCMCAGALVHARVSRVVFGAKDPRAGALGSAFDLAESKSLNHCLRVTGGVLEAQSATLLKRFFRDRRCN